jgi:hypothetical protein
MGTQIRLPGTSCSVATKELSSIIHLNIHVSNYKPTHFLYIMFPARTLPPATDSAPSERRPPKIQYNYYHRQIRSILEVSDHERNERGLQPTWSRSDLRIQVSLESRHSNVGICLAQGMFMSTSQRNGRTVSTRAL